MDDKSEDNVSASKPRPTVSKKKSEDKVPAAKPRPTVSKKRRKHKPKDFPKRPLSAYNIFFKETRQVMLVEKLKEVGKDNVDFQSMVKEIAQRWKKLSPNERVRVDGLAKTDLVRYKEEVRLYEEEMVKKSRKEREDLAAKKKQEEEAESAASAQKEQDERLNTERLAHLADAAHGAQSTEDMQRILAEELMVIESAREMKLRQLAQLQAGAPPQQQQHQHLLSGLQTHRMGGGLSGFSADHELDLLRRQAGLSQGLSLQGSHLGDLGLTTPGGYYPHHLPAHPSAGLSYHSIRQDALLRNLQEQELSAAQYGRTMSATEQALAGYGAPRGMISSDLLAARFGARGQGLLPGELHEATGAPAGSHRGFARGSGLEDNSRSSNY